MRLGLQLAAFGIILLLPKTHLFLSNTDFVPAAQTVPERSMSAPQDRRGPNATDCLTDPADGKRAKDSACVAKLGRDGTLAVHTMDASQTGS